MTDTLALNAVHVGDICDLAPRLAPGSVNCIVTSPPYFGLRDYGTARWEGGDAGCDHIERRQHLNVGFNERWGNAPGQKKQEQTRATQYGDRCGKCGAVRVDEQLGLEPTVGEYVANLVAVFRALRPALRDDGTLWVNMGDSYSTGGNGGGGTCKQASNRGSHLPPKHTPGLPPKCLTLAPARFAIAMVEDGWILRSEMTGIKVAPMPESVRDRPTSATEKLYMFVKQPRYWYDALAVAEPASSDERFHGGYAGGGRTQAGNGRERAENDVTTRNARNWFYWRPEPFSGSHYATFPSAIPRRAIRAGCPPRVCARCGSPWVRETASGNPSKWANVGGVDRSRGAARTANPQTSAGLHRNGGTLMNTRRALGWRAGCACDAETVPGVVMDPFGGSGTVAQVAVEEGRRWLLCDLDERAVAWTRQRLDGRQIRLGGLEASSCGTGSTPGAASPGKRTRGYG